MSMFQVGDIVRVVAYDDPHLIDTKWRLLPTPKNFIGKTGVVIFVDGDSTDVPFRDPWDEFLSVKFNNLYPDKEVSKIQIWDEYVQLFHRPAPKEQMALIEEVAA